MKLFNLFKNRRNKTSRKITRITIDLDTKDINQLIKCLKTLKKYQFYKDLQIRQSPSERGYHIIAWADKGVTLKKLITIRRKAGDDKTRCDLDTWGSGQRMINVLFTHKKRKEIKPKEIETHGNEVNVKVSYGET